MQFGCLLSQKSKCGPLAIHLALGLLAAAPVLAKPKIPADVLVVADAASTEAAENLRPEPGRPIYYIILGGVAADLGSPWAGDHPPDPQLVRTEVIKTLATQGYIETKVGGPVPQIVLVLSWGQANLALDEFTSSEDDPTASADQPAVTDVTTTVAYNAREMGNLIGLGKANRKQLSGSEVEQLNDAYRSDRYYIMVAALDAQALRKKVRKFVWRTRMSIDAHREDFTQNLQAMLSSAAPYFGRSEDRPIIVDEKVRNATVRMGETKFLGESSKPENSPNGK
jgi:hypothetical protein